MPTREQQNKKRIAKNTLFLYFRMLFLICVQLYSVPLVLKGLGVEGYGIYSVVGGIVTLFSFIGGALASGSQRFLAFAIGKNDNLLLKQVFDTTATIYIGMSLIFLLTLDPICVWFLNNRMSISENYLFAANIVLQLSFISFIISLVSIPINAAVIAHEKMSIFAYVSILEGVLKLIVASLLIFFKNDVLIIYASMILGINIIVFLVYQIYCRMNFSECRNFHFCFEKNTRKQLASYLSWNIIGSLANILKQQGVNIVINLFFGALLNAAHAIAQQLYGVLNQFINNIYLASRPQLTKSYASGKTEEMWSLMNLSSKIVFFLLTLISIPLLVEGKFLLTIWLGDLPPYMLDMLRLFVISLLLETLVNPIIGVFQAQNKIRRYQIYSSTILLLVVPTSYIILKFFSSNPLIPYYIMIGLSACFALSILIIAKQDLLMDTQSFVKSVLVREITIFLISLGLTAFIASHFEPSIWRMVLTTGVTLFSLASTIWMIGINKQERNNLKNLIKKRLTHERS